MSRGNHENREMRALASPTQLSHIFHLCFVAALAAMGNVTI